MAKKQLSSRRMNAKAIDLKPNLRFGAETAFARCKKAWLQLFEDLYRAEITAEAVEVTAWAINTEKASVTLSVEFNSSFDGELSQKLPAAIRFAVDEFVPQLGKLKGTKSASARRKLCAKFREWIADAIVRAFQSEPVQVEYSWFNQDDCPFSASMTMIADKVTGKPMTLWSNTRKSVWTKKNPNPKKSAPQRIDYSTGTWQRFYFDDGKTRRFWYVQCKGGTQTVIQGNLGDKGKKAARKLKSPKEAKDATQKQIDKKLSDGFIPYDTDALTFRRKNRFVIRLIKKAMAEFEQQHGLRISEQYRSHLLTINGGTLSENQFISLPGHPYLKRKHVGDILGLRARQPAWDLTYCSGGLKLASGHTLVAGTEEGYFMIDPSGVILLPDARSLDERDLDDDQVVHLKHLPTFVVAHCFDEFLTRLAKYPNDTNVAPPVNRPKPHQQDQPDREKVFAKAHAAAQKSPFRRFFFDDGKLQKYWNIETKEKQFTTFYGRFGRPASDTTKRYATVEEAGKAADKIIRQKVQKGYQEILPEALRIKRPKGLRKTTPSTIDKLEKEIGFELPQEYRRFLGTQNGGQPSPRFIEIPSIEWIEDVEVRFLFGLYSKSIPGQSLSWAIKEGGKILPKGHLPIAYGSDWFTLSLKRKPGCVYFWDHDNDDIYEDDPNGRFRNSAGHLLANSFDEFLTRIAILHETGIQ